MRKEFKGLKLKIAHGSNVGKRRTNNEDSYLVSSPLFVVADGMGGHAKGEVASDTACEAVLSHMEKIKPGDIDELQEDLVAAYLSAQQAVQNIEYRKYYEYSPGTTLTSIYFHDDAIVTHVGDSVAYRMRDKLEKLTKDHGYGHSLDNFVGINDSDLRIDQKTVEYEAGDVFLLATDGLTNHVKDSEIEQVLSGLYNYDREIDQLYKDIDENSIDEIVEILTNMCLNRGGSDNVTLIVIKVSK